MVDRVQVEDLRGPQRLTPQATPVRRAAADLNNGRSLAQAFQNLQGSSLQAGSQLSSYAEQKQLDAAKPKARILARDFNRHVLMEYMRSNVKSSANPQEHAQFLADSEARFFEGKEIDATVMGLARPAIDGSLDNLSNRLASDAARVTYQDISADLATETTQILAMSDLLPAEEINSQLATGFNDATANGLAPGDARTALVSSAITVAERTMNPDVLDAIENFKFPSGARLVDAKTKASIQNARESIRSRQIAEENLAYSRENRQRDRFSREVFSRAFSLLEGDPEADLSQYREALAAVNPQAASTLISYQNSMTSLDRLEDPRGTNQTWFDLFENPSTRSPEWILKQSQKYNIPPRTVQEMMELGGRLSRSGRGGGDVFKTNPLLKELLDTIDSTINQRGVMGNLLSTDGPVKSMDAQVLVRRGVMRWMAENPEHTELELIELARTYRDRALEIYMPAINEKVQERDASAREGRFDELIGFDPNEVEEETNPFANPELFNNE